MDNIVIDTNPLVYIYHAVPIFGKKYVDLLGELSQKNILLIPKIVYGELSIIFGSDKELDRFLNDTGIIIGDINPKAYITAAKRWEVYNKRRILMCPKCGKKLGKLTCRKCGVEIRIRQHILTDFIIGAYTLQMDKKQLVTNDAGYYGSYFPELTIITA